MTLDSLKEKANESKVVYISSPYSGDIEGNTMRARDYCRYAVEEGCIPFAPHLLYPQFMSEETQRKQALEMCVAMIERCDEFWIFGRESRYWSEGMTWEYEYARMIGKPVWVVEVEDER